MLVFWKEKLVILAVPKTGTTALEGALAPRAAMVLRDPPHLKHSTVYRYRRFLEPYFAKAGGQPDMETVASVRHPVDWLSSWFRYRHRDDLDGHANSTRGMQFDDFVLEYIKNKPRPFANVGSQAKFMLTEKGHMGINHLFRYEGQKKLIQFLEERLDTKITLDRLNVSPTLPLTLSPDVAKALEAAKPEDFAIWEQGQA